MGVILTDAGERASSTVSRPLVIAAAAFAASTAFSSVVADRGIVEGAPFEVKLPISVRTGLLAGWGAASPHPGRCRRLR